MTLKKFVLIAHLWLGLASGLIVLFLGITGCMLAFEREIENVTQSYRFVQEEERPMVSPSKVKEIATTALPGKSLHSVTYEGGKKAIQASFYNADPEYYYIVFINPYSGEVLKIKNMNRDFFRVVIMGHYYLWLPPTIGQPIVASATLIFFIMLVTGIILWWPQNSAARKQRFSIKWSAKWRRVNYDVHNVLGFYVTWVIIFIVITGLVWGFQWVSKSMYYTLSGGKKLILYEETFSAPKPASFSSSGPAVDRIWQIMKKEHSNAQLIEVHYPENDSVAIEAVANPDASTYWKSDYRYFDQYTLKEIPVRHIYSRFKDAKLGDKVLRMNYDVHVGAILGLPGKVMAFFASLIAASLPVTGVIIWWGKKKKKKYHPVTVKAPEKEYQKS
ncbi:PepSY-associated TM helix domain-containing protein [Danxiaibacter flavus]|uniref:PepSY-associated TM helix domain-containing protein n=1 Tax=Danxiaibacter flavus TaxID=3049108 RepID=A0ABV3ZHP1_9BACT|nr:PepSY-associated TM helix domain-containing protein [Chitinophagaceae bacterium DXS]